MDESLNPDIYATTVTTTTLSSSDIAAIMAMMWVWGMVALVLLVLQIVILWRIFVKAGQPGWASIIPIYNAYIFLKVCGRPGWWLLLFLIPPVAIVLSVILAIDLAKAFGRSATFGVIGVWLFSLIGLAMLAFGSDQYKGVAAAADSQPSPAPSAPVEAAPAAAPAPAEPAK